METGIPHQFIADLDPAMLNATTGYLMWRAEQMNEAG